jgi:hypothetical protein
MTATQTLIARAALGVVTASAGFIAVSIERFRAGSSRTFDRFANATFVVSRFGLYGLLFFVLHLTPRGDIPAYYFPEASAALHGALPYRDFASSYAPLHSYLDGAAILLWRSPLAIILLAILFEAVLLPVWLKLGRELFSEQSVRTAAILYIASPISLQFVAVDGQDNVIVALFLALAILCLLKHRAAVSGALVALGVVCIKFLPLLYFPAFFLVARNRVRWFLGFAGVLAVGYGGFALLHLPLLSPLMRQGDLKTASNLTYVIESVCGVDIPSRVGDVLFLLILAAIFVLIARALRRASEVDRLRILVFGIAALTLALLVFSKKSWPPYLMFALFPINFLLTEGSRRRLRLAAFALFSMIAVVVQSYWATVFAQPLAPAFHRMLLTRQPAVLFFLGLQVLVVAGYLWLFFAAMQRIVCRQKFNLTERAPAAS